MKGQTQKGFRSQEFLSIRLLQIRRTDSGSKCKEKDRNIIIKIEKSHVLTFCVAAIF